MICYSFAKMEVEEEFSSYVPMKMKVNQKQGLLDYQATPSPSLPSSIGSSPSPPSSKINGAVLFIFVILAVLFFISGLLHLLIRFLTKSPSASESNGNNQDGSSSDAIQRQLQQLFHLHDSGLDQSFIDALPVFAYMEIVGLQDHFDCAVCLCEFLDVDKLRLLPMCGHAFHMGCIDTWLLSNSTCPLCRGALLSPGFSIENPMFNFDDFIDDDGCPNYGGNGSSNTRKRVEIEDMEKESFPIRLGKFRKLDDSGVELHDEIIGSSKLDARRCYSMGSYQYVVGNANLRVALRQSRENSNLAKTTDDPIDNMEEGKKISIGTKTDSYSVSKIWLWSKKAKFASSSLEPQSSPYFGSPWMHRTTQGFS